MYRQYSHCLSALLCGLFALVLGTVSAQTNRTARETALQFLQSNPAQFELSAADVSDVKVIREYSSKHNGVTHVWVQQQLAGIPVSNGLFGLHVRPNGEVAHLGHDFISNLQGRVNTTLPSISASKSLALAMTALGLDGLQLPNLKEKTNDRNWIFEKGEISKKEIPVSICFHKERNGQLRLGWLMIIDQAKSADLWSITIDAQSGQVLRKQNHTIYCKAGHPHRVGETCDAKAPATPFKYTSAKKVEVVMDETYNVFALPTESPAHGARQLVTNPAFPEASPYGWLDVNGAVGNDFTYTRGNNTWTFDDSSNDDTPVAADAASGGSTLNFDFPYSANNEPGGNRDAAIANLFYMNNMLHDITYIFGFEESAGNFQAKNYKPIGQEGDEVYAQALDGSGTNNANFSTPPDGSNGRMQMYVWSGTAGGNVKVNEPGSVSGTYIEGGTGGAWGGVITSTPLTADVVLMDDGSGDPTWGCQPFTIDVEGKIVMIDRGGCEFGAKSLAVQQKGAVGCIICDHEDPPISGSMGAGAVGAQVTIPVVSMKKADCALLRQYAGSTLNMTFVTPTAGTGPAQLDGSFDNGIIAHEFGHGLSNRLTGDGFSCLGNAEQMGEGWSDWVTLVMTVNPGDQGVQKQGVGTFVLRQTNDGVGIRRYPYSTNMSISPITYGTVAENPAVHALGEIWAATLWDLYWNMVEKYGYDSDLSNTTSGNFRAMQLVIDGMKLQPCSPGFISGRDAILLADEMNYSSVDTCLIMSTFARRGMGINASQGANDNATDGIENFDPIPTCVKELKIIKTTSTPTINPGEEASFEIVVTNHRDETVQNVVVTDPIPSGMTFVSATNGGSNVGGIVTWNLGAMPTGQVKTLAYTLKSDPTIGSIRTFGDVMDEEIEWYSTFSEGDQIFQLETDDVKVGTSAWRGPATETACDYTLETTVTFEVTGNKPTFRFWHKYDTEKGSDGGFLEFKDVNSASQAWIRLPKEKVYRNSYDGKISYATVPIPGLYGFSGSSNGWVESFVDLSDFVGKTLTMRFRFASDAAATVPDGQWIVDGLEMNNVLNYVTEACITGTNANTACAATPNAGVVINPVPVGTNEPLANNGILMTVQPNPATQFVQVSLSKNMEGSIQVDLYSTDGRLVLSNQRNGLSLGSMISLDVQNIPTGVYSIRLQSNLGTSTEKVVIKH